MPRLLGVEIPEKKKILYSLCYIYGIGLHKSKNILKNININEDIRTDKLTEEEINKISSEIMKNNFKIEGDLRREVISNIKRLQSIKSYRGFRHSKGLPTRGQRTKSNARTRKGKRKTIGVLTKAKAKKS